VISHKIDIIWKLYA